MSTKTLLGYLIAAVFGAGIFWAGSKLTAKTTSGWQLTYAHSETGEALSGSKAALVAAVKEGKNIRVYFRGRRVEHLADAGFITVFGGEVFAQTQPIETQAPSLEPAKVRFREPGRRWRAIVSTSGEFTAFADGNEPNIRTQAIKWYVQD